MKKIINNLIAFLGTVVLFTACSKVDDLPAFTSGTVPVLTANKTAVTTAPVDSNNVAITFNWTNPAFATDSANYKYVIEIDSAGRNFSKAVSRTITKSLSVSYTGKEFNNVLLSFGFAFNVSYPVEIRVIASYLNNNDRKISNVVRINATPYKVPPRVVLPASGRLWFVGDASSILNTWNNTASIPANRELTKIDETTWGGILDLTGSGSYLLIHTAGQWGKYSIINALPNTAMFGVFGSEFPDNFQGNVTGGAGPYRMIFDFQRGTYTLTKITNSLPTDLWITGDATTSSWTNAPPPAQKLTAVTNGVWKITQAFVPGKVYKFLPINGSWQPQIGGSSATGGTLDTPPSGTDAANIPTPSVAGNYEITLNFITNTYTVVKL